MDLDRQLEASVQEALMRAAVSQEFELSRSARFAIANFIAKIAVLLMLLHVSFEHLIGSLLALTGKSDWFSTGTPGFSWPMLVPMATVCYLFHKLYRHDRDRAKLSSRLTLSTIEAIRRDLLD